MGGKFDLYRGLFNLSAALDRMTSVNPPSDESPSFIVHYKCTGEFFCIS